MKTCFLYSIFILCGFYVTAQVVHVEADLSSQEYLIGDYIRLDLQITNDINADLQFPDPQNILHQFELINVSAIDTLRQAGSTLYKQEIVFSVYDSGLYTIDPIVIFYTKQNDTNRYFAASDSIRFLVNTIPVDTTQAIKPIKDIIAVETKNYLWYYIIGGAIVALFAGWGIYLSFKHRKKEKTEEVILTPQTLYEITYNKLKELEAKKLWQKDLLPNGQSGTKLYYSELTDILREYIERRYQLPALESTSDEIIELLVRAGIEGEEINHINHILHLADLAKFAKSKPLPNENILAMNHASEFVDATKQMEIAGNELLTTGNNGVLEK